MNRILVVVVLISSVASCIAAKRAPSQASTSIIRLTPDSGCLDASMFGAVSNDDVDDSAALRAFDESSATCLRVYGRLDFDTPQSTLTQRRPYGMIRLHSGKKLLGDYSTSELNFRGDVQLTDWHGIEVAGDNIVVEGIRFETAELTDTSEQTHEIWGIGPLNHVTVRSNVFSHPCHEGFKGGDNIEIFGYADRMVRNLIIQDNESMSSCRSFLASHSGVDGATVTGNVTHDSRGQDLDLEGDGSIAPTASSGAHRNWTIAHNSLSVGEHSVGNYAIQLASAADVVFAQNIVSGRGVNFYSCDNCSLIHNLIENFSSVGGGLPTVEVIKLSSNFRMVANEISRRGDMMPGVLLHVGPHETGEPSDVLLAGNLMTQGTSESVIISEGVVGLTLLGGSISYGGSTLNKYFGLIANGSSKTRTDALIVSGVTFMGPMKGAVGLSGSYAGGGRSVFIDNSMDSAVQHGLMCGNVAQGSQILGPVVQILEKLTKNDCGPVGFVRIIP